MINQPILNQHFSSLFHLDSTFFDIHIHFPPHHVVSSCYRCTNSQRIDFSSDIYSCHQEFSTHEVSTQQMKPQILHNHKKKLKTYHNNEKIIKLNQNKEKKTRLFSWQGRSSTETTSKGFKSFFEAYTSEFISISLHFAHRSRSSKNTESITL